MHPPTHTHRKQIFTLLTHKKTSMTEEILENLSSDLPMATMQPPK